MTREVKFKPQISNLRDNFCFCMNCKLKPSKKQLISRQGQIWGVFGGWGGGYCWGEFRGNLGGKWWAFGKILRHAIFVHTKFETLYAS